MVEALHTLPADFLLRRHTLEYYISKELTSRLYFLNVIPISPNDTGEYTNVIESGSTIKDIIQGNQSLPAEAGEATELPTVSIEPIRAVSGRTKMFGFNIAWTPKRERFSQFTADINIAVKKIITAMSYQINQTIVEGLVASAGLSAPDDLSDWGQDDYDPRGDFVKIRSKYTEDTGVFQATNAYLSNSAHVLLQEYMASFDKSFTAEEIDVDGTTAYNVGGSFTSLDKDFLIFDRGNPPGILEAVLDPDYSALSQEDVSGNTPPAIINVNQYQEEKSPHRKYMEVWADIGYNSREPDSVMTGQFIQP